MSYIGSKNADVETSFGLVPGRSTLNKFGMNPSLALNTTEVVWTAGTTPYPWQAAATAIDLQSTSGNDDGSPAGTGAWTVLVQGLDGSFLEQEETITMNGAGAVRVPGTWIRVHRMEVIRAGSSMINEGNITCVTSPGGVTIAEINALKGQTLMAVYTLPAGKEAIVRGGFFRMNSATAASTAIDCNFFVRENADDDGAFNVKESGSVNNTSTSSLFRPLAVAGKITGPADMYVDAKSNKAAASVDAGFDLTIRDIPA